MVGDRVDLGGLGVRLKQGASLGKGGDLCSVLVCPPRGLGDFFIRVVLVLFQGTIDPYCPCGVLVSSLLRMPSFLRCSKNNHTEILPDLTASAEGFLAAGPSSPEVKKKINF